jgi:pyrimidine nucleoside transport protein
MLISSGVFAFQALAAIFFLSFIVQILYYYGAMQWFMLSVGWLLQKSMGTTVCESVNAAASIFIGMVRPRLPTPLTSRMLSGVSRSARHQAQTVYRMET